MQAVILVGGEGTRLRPLTYATPKPMVPLFGVPFLERTLARLRGAGVTEAILASGYLPQSIIDHFGDGSRIGMNVQYVVETSPLGTAGAIRNVADKITGTFFVLNGDVLTSLDLAAMIAFHRDRGGLGVLHAIRVDDPSAFGCIVSDDSGRISQFVEKPPRETAPTDQINAGTYLLERAILDAIPAGRPVSVERETFPQLLADGRPLYCYATADYWLDVGRPAQYLQAHDDVLAGKLPLVAPGADVAECGTLYLAGSTNAPANVKLPSFIGFDVSLDPASEIGPRAVIGPGCIVGAKASVRESVLWDGIEIGDGARVERAVLASNACVGAHAVVSIGSVIGHGASVEENAVLPPDSRVAGPGAPATA